MKKEMREYLCGERNVVEDRFILSREKTSSAEHIRLLHREIEEPIVTAWQPRRKWSKVKRPKHTGGKKPYVMLMLMENDKVADKITPDGALFLLRVLRNIDWGTGVLVDLRTKEPLKFLELLGIMKVGKRRLMRAIKNLRELKLLDSNQGGYVVSRELIKRGGRYEA